MRPVLSQQEAQSVDAASPMSMTTLMERAGMAVAINAVKMGVGYGSRVAVLAGPGNNGGDGYVAARYLHNRGVGVVVHVLASPNARAAAEARRSAERAGVTIVPIGRPGGNDLSIDALFGGGFHGSIPDPVQPWLAAKAPVLAVDLPSGLDPATGGVTGGCFQATRTVTFHSLKLGHLLGEGPDRSGTVVVADIGLVGGEPSLMVVEEEDAPRPGRHRTAHKWSAGSVLVVGGAEGMTGAAVMAGRAALHFGAGAVGVAVPSRQLPVAASLASELLIHSIDQLPERLVAVAGPGLGADHGLVVQGLLESHPGPLVLDADGIKSTTVDALSRRTGVTILTPHAGEFRRLTGEEPDPETARALAARTGCVVILKGNPTFVTDGSTPWVVRSGGPELATIGTGDVLAGMVGALCARGLDPFVAARSAAYWHGVAGADLASRETVTADRLASWVGRFAW